VPYSDTLPPGAHKNQTDLVTFAYTDAEVGQGIVVVFLLGTVVLEVADGGMGASHVPGRH
jgi:hypothetical protein